MIGDYAFGKFTDSLGINQAIHAAIDSITIELAEVKAYLGIL